MNATSHRTHLHRETRQYQQDTTLRPLDYNYHNFEQLTKYLRTVNAQYPSLTALYSIGKSVQGRDLWVMVVSASPYEHMLGKPNIKLVGNIHGNEVVGKELLLHLIEVSLNYSLIFFQPAYNWGLFFSIWLKIIIQTSL